MLFAGSITVLIMMSTRLVNMQLLNGVWLRKLTAVGVARA